MIKTKKIIAFWIIAISGFFIEQLQAQSLKIPAPSPLAINKQSVALSEVTIEYSRPSVKGRTIFGDLVPFGKVWRTGANASTKITFGEDVKLDGNPVPAGTYALYTIPDKEEWTIILNKNLTLWGSDGYKQEEDYLRFKVKTSALSNKVESLTFNIADLSPNSAIIEMVWEQTRIAFNLTVDIDTKVMKNIETSLAADKRPYFQAATYYYDNGKDMKQALVWVNKALEQSPKGYWILLLKDTFLIKTTNIGLQNYNMVSQLSNIFSSGAGGLISLQGQKSITTQLPGNMRAGASLVLGKRGEIGVDFIVPLNTTTPGSFQNPVISIGGDFMPVKWLKLQAGFVHGGYYGNQVPLGILFVAKGGTYEVGIASRDIVTFFTQNGPNLSLSMGFMRVRF